MAYVLSFSFCASLIDVGFSCARALYLLLIMGLERLMVEDLIVEKVGWDIMS
jgi:hypothetical protein